MPILRKQAVLESAVNAFIVVNSRSSGLFSRDTEVHMPTYKPTRFAVVSGNTFTEAEPYKYFVPKGTGTKDNYMMWALMIPGEFRYPAERKDIRSAYKYFNAWAASGGVEHVDWYEDETDEDMLKNTPQLFAAECLRVINTNYRLRSMRSIPCRVAAPRRIVLQKR